jgi:acetyltransferase-like isoleucine patch superfamily enzyme
MGIKSFLFILGRIIFLWKKIKRRLLMGIYRQYFAVYGKNFWFDPDGDYSYENIYVGNDVNLGIKPRLSASHCKIIIGNKVMFGPEVKIYGGNHTTTFLGRFMVDVTEMEKKPEDDLGVVIQDDVWVGSCSIIVSGVTIGRGSIVGAGSVVTKSVPPYAVIAGNPARVIKYRWGIDEILLHEASLYPKEKRLILSDIERYQKE